MREILFRGKRIDNGEWVEGLLTIDEFITPEHTIKRVCCIKAIPNEKHECLYWTQVISETVGQYTGLTDKNGKKIFEGDIINIEYPETVVENAVIEYVGTSFYGSTDYDDWELDGYYELEIIGNIHDNSKLLNN